VESPCEEVREFLTDLDSRPPFYSLVLPTLEGSLEHLSSVASLESLEDLVRTVMREELVTYVEEVVPGHRIVRVERRQIEGKTSIREATR
jgi:hypothetical protein